MTKKIVLKKAKIDYRYLKDNAGTPDGKLILVTAINPTPAGEGKTTTSVGLADGLRRIGKKSVLALREPSLGPVFGVKGGAAGGGYAQVIPIKTIAAIHDRTEGAIKSQLKRIENGWIAVTWEVRPERHGAPWLQEEKDDVRNEYENGIAIEQIAESHQRSPEAIRKNLIVQGLIEN